MTNIATHAAPQQIPESQLTERDLLYGLTRQRYEALEAEEQTAQRIKFLDTQEAKFCGAPLSIFSGMRPEQQQTIMTEFYMAQRPHIAGLDSRDFNALTEAQKTQALAIHTSNIENGHKLEELKLETIKLTKLFRIFTGVTVAASALYAAHLYFSVYAKPAPAPAFYPQPSVISAAPRR